MKGGIIDLLKAKIWKVLDGAPRIVTGLPYHLEIDCQTWPDEKGVLAQSPRTLLQAFL